jgi:hypothetical protein
MKREVNMARLLSLLCLILLTFGYVSKKEKELPQGPLSKINSYQVAPLFYPHETATHEELNEHVIALLKTLGTVQVKADDTWDDSDSDAIMLFGLNEWGDSRDGSIKVLAQAEVIVNRQKICSEVWRSIFLNPAGTYPVDTEQGIAFIKDETAVCPDIKTIAAEIVEQFGTQYRQDNPGTQPTFYFHSDFLNGKFF